MKIFLWFVFSWCGITGALVGGTAVVNFIGGDIGLIIGVFTGLVIGSAVAAIANLDWWFDE